MDLSYFGPAIIDQDETRDAPVTHRFVHGSFQGTDTRFSFYFPPPEQYGRRFIQWLEGGAAGHDRTVEAGGPLTRNALSHAFALGAYLVESNQGHIADEPARPKPRGSVTSYLASVATARFSREMAQRIYGEAPEYAYVSGISGGGLRSIVCLERGEGTWDGAVPCAIPHSGMFYALAEHAARTLGDSLEAVIDATDVGGTGDPFAGLSVEQASVLADLYRTGFARGAEFMLRPGYFPVGYGLTELFRRDPDYFDAFWTQRGYPGFETPEKFEGLRVETKATIVGVVTPRNLIPPETPPDVMEFMAAMLGGIDTPVGAMLDGVVEQDLPKLSGATITLLSGAATGRMLYAANAMGPLVMGANYATGGEVFHSVEPGDEVLIDNRHHIAFRFAYRHEITVEEDRFPDLHPEWRHLTVDGRPIYRQRRPAWTFDGTFASELYQHEFAGKMLLVQNALDGTNWPVHAHNYATRVHDQMGERAEEAFRLYWTDSAAHGPASMYPPGSAPVVATRVIDYEGLLFQALAHLVDWVENGVEPPLSSGYEWGPDGRLTLRESASERQGLQPVVNLTSQGQSRVEARAGERVEFSAEVECAPAGGHIIAAEWDFDGSGSFSVKEDDLQGNSATIELRRAQVFEVPGTYFPAVRAWSQRDGDPSATLFRVANIGRMRVVIT
jgi:hypothetical protein